MTKINDILRKQYSKQYSGKTLRMKYSAPKIYPKILTSKPASSFTQKEKKEILSKWSVWYVYYRYRNPVSGLLEKQPSISLSVNRDFPKFEDRLKRIKIIRDTLEKVLEDGYSPYESEDTQKEYSTRAALEYVLALKKLELKKTSYDDYETRANHFLEYLRRKGIDKKSISSLEKTTVNNYLNTVLKKTSPSNRNNTKTVLSALFTKLVNESFIKHNFIKEGIPKLKSKPKKNTAFTQEEVKAIFKHLKEKDTWLYYFCAHVYYGLFRNIEIVRINIADINLTEKLIKSNTKTGRFYKQIPQILIDEFYSNLDLSKYPYNYSLFTKYDKPEIWYSRYKNENGEKKLTDETNRRGYFGKRFTKVARKPLGFSEDYTIYSLRHSAIGKYFVSMVEKYKKENVPNFEEKALNSVRTITLHKSNEVVRNYLREIGYYKVDDWSDILK
jgi:integrase